MADNASMVVVRELTFSTRDRAPLVADEAERRACVAAVLRAAERCDGCGLIGFCLRRDRLRLIVVAERARFGRLRGALHRVLGTMLDAELAEPDVRELRHRAHILSVLRNYVAPVEEDAFEVPSALASGSCFPDLVGARRIRGARLVAHQQLPRLRVRTLLEWLGLPPSLRPIAPSDLWRLGACRITSAAAFAAGVPTPSVGMGTDVVAARAAVARLAVDSGIAPREIARATGSSARTIRCLAASASAPPLESAVLLRLGLEEAVRRQAMGEPVRLPT